MQCCAAPQSPQLVLQPCKLPKDTFSLFACCWRTTYPARGRSDRLVYSFVYFRAQWPLLDQLQNAVPETAFPWYQHIATSLLYLCQMPCPMPHLLYCDAIIRSITAASPSTWEVINEAFYMETTCPDLYCINSVQRHAYYGATNDLTIDLDTPIHHHEAMAALHQLDPGIHIQGAIKPAIPWYS